MNLKYLLVTGMFRTGSTFLTKALDAHKEITAVLGTHFYFFKALRNEIFKREGYLNFDKESPISDNFYSEFMEVNSKIRNCNLKIPIKHNTLKEILENIRIHIQIYSPKIAPLLKEIKAKTYDELFEKLINSAYRTYSNRNTIYCGFRATFVEQFLEVLLNTYPDIKCIYMVRDPRAVLASNNLRRKNPHFGKRIKTRGRYPLLYVVRHWRKSIAYLLDNIDKNRNIFPLKYENLIAYPKKYFREICNFLDLDYDTAMSDARRYKDGKGKRWNTASAYRGFAANPIKFMNKWENVLSDKEIQLVEDLCFPEMELLGYKRLTDDNIIRSLLNAPSEDIEEIDPWIRPYIDSYTFNNKKEVEKELLRRSSMNIKINNSKSEKNFLEKIYIGKNYLKKLHKLNRGFYEI